MMNITQRLYEQDAYLREFKANVLSCEEKDGAYYVILDKTAFFPEGGGQAADLGTINGVNVLDVQIKDDIITHKTEAAVPVGTEAECAIDWDLRFSRMQGHAGEHIVSGIVNSMFGYTNVGFHLGDEVITVDFDGPLTLADIEKVELESNIAIYKNANITATYPSKEELSSIDYRSKLDLEDGVRLVTIDGIDVCACCAPHPKATGEIGIVKIIDFYPHKKGTRVEMIAGINAVRDYMELNAANKYLMGLLSAARDGVKEAVAKQNDVIVALRAENQKLSRKLAVLELVPTMIDDSGYAFSENLSYDDLRYCANNLLENGLARCALFSKLDDEHYAYVVSSAKNDVKEIVAVLNKTLNGKGGGKPNYAQGRVAAKVIEEIVPVIENIFKGE